MKTTISPTWIVCGILVVAAVLIAGAGYFVVVAPQRAQTSKLAAEITNAQELLTVDEGPRATPVPFDASDLYRFAVAMPGTDDDTGILLDLVRVAGASSVNVTSVRVATRVPLALGYFALPLVVVINGKYAGITAFLARLRHDVSFDANHVKARGRLFVANEVTLANGNGTGGGVGGAPLMATLDLDAFVYAAPAPVAPTVDPSTTPATGSAA